jgi:HSP20 family protein
MPTLIRRNPGIGSAFDVDPFHLVREMLRWHARDAAVDAFDQPSAGRNAQRQAYAPNVDIKETPNEFLIEADLPGFAEEDVDVSVTGNQLTLTGKRKFEEKKENEQYISFERSYGSFTRSFTLPDHIDSEKIAAELKDGVLKLNLPKRPELKARKIELKGLAPQSKTKA